MTLHFFPRDRRFWLYHLGATLFTGAMSLVTMALWGRLENVYLATTLVWALPYTAAMLGWRWAYLRRGWAALPMGRLIPLAIVYSTAAGLLVAACVQALVLPLFWQEVVDAHAASGTPLITQQFLVRRLVGDALQSQLFIAAWIFIYTSVTGHRRIQAADLANLRLQNNLKEVQLSHLSSQLNPHFLFNALNNIRFMIHEDADRADGMLVALSGILRYSLEGTRQDKVRLDREISVIDEYMAIVSGQFEQRLRFEMDVPAHLHGCLIPPMVPQMLIENAIKHGIDQLREGGDVRVEASAHDGGMRLSVINDIPPDCSATTGMGIGLQNIRQRLHLLYGDRASLDVIRHPTRFEAILQLPMESA